MVCATCAAVCGLLYFSSLRPIATDTHDFPALKRDGKIYVDKTMFIHRLVANADSKLFFMSRPRRFGKSLTVSALKFKLKVDEPVDRALSCWRQAHLAHWPVVRQEFAQVRRLRCGAVRDSLENL